MLRTFSILLLFSLAHPLIGQTEISTDTVNVSAAVQEDDSGWYQPSFWRTVDGQPVEDSWQFLENEIRLIHPRGGRGSLLSPPMPENFELSFEWMIDPKANNGLKYRVRWFGDRWLGIEYQMMDEPIPLAESSVGSTASIYDLFAPTLDKPLLPAGQWNQAKIIALGDRLEHYLNGSLVAEARTSDAQWQAAVARSKFYGFADFGQPRSGDSIMLTDHGGLAAYRNFQFTQLPFPTESDDRVELVPQLGNGLRNSWADQTSIVLWTRTTARAEMLTSGLEFSSIPKEKARALSESSDAEELTRVQMPEGASLEQMSGACPGAEGEVRLTYFPESMRYLSQTTPWTPTSAAQDYTHQWKLDRLLPGTRYVAIVEARPIDGKELTAVLRGGFQTVPPKDGPVPVTFCVTTCHDFIRRDDGSRGHLIYPAMGKIAPDFVVHAGDVEYYDQPNPWAWTIDLMRFKWARLFSLPSNRSFYANHTTYWIKDDHDTLKDDCWPGERYGAVSFEEGVQIFNEEQFPTRDPRYMTVKWGKDLQFWILEGRDFRSPNTMPDGPDKTILGSQQKQWLKETLEESTATFKLIFTPTPIVGPDRKNKHDNHANEDFSYEGDELRALFSRFDQLFIFCGDRHWQYASVSADAKLWEFGCGPGSEHHQLGWKQDDIRPEHRFLRVQGGFLSGSIEMQGPEEVPVLTLQHHDVRGGPVSHFQFPSQR